MEREHPGGSTGTPEANLAAAQGLVRMALGEGLPPRAMVDLYAIRALELCWQLPHEYRGKGELESSFDLSTLEETILRYLSDVPRAFTDTDVLVEIEAELRQRLRTNRL